MNHSTRIIQHKNPLLQLQHPLMRFNWLDYAEKTPIEDPRMVTRLVNNLKYLFNIDSGDYLTFVLGHGECTNNEQALKYWVLDELSSTSIGQGDVLEHLVSKLKEQIMLEVYQ